MVAEVNSPTTFFLQDSPWVPTSRILAGLFDLPLSPKIENQN